MEQDLKSKEIKPGIISQHSVVYKFAYDLCNAAWRTISYNMAAAHANCATFWTLTYKRCEELYKEKYGNFPNFVKNCPFARQASIYSHVPKSSSQKGCMNLSLRSVFSKHRSQRTATSQRRWNFVLFRQHSPCIVSKIVQGCVAEQEKNKFQVARV